MNKNTTYKQLEDKLVKYKDLKDEYSEEVTDAKKQILKEKINKTKCAIAIWHLENIKKSRKERMREAIS